MLGSHIQPDYHELRRREMLTRKIRENSVFKNIINNTGWLLFDRILTILIGTTVGVLLARHFGPEEFGIYTFAIAFVSFFDAFAMLGLNSIVVREIVNKPEVENEIVATAVVLQFAAGTLAAGIVLLVIWFWGAPAWPGQILVSILTLKLILKCGSIPKSWFEAKVRSKYVVWAESSILVVITIVKLVLLFLGASVVLFAVVVVLSELFRTIADFLLYRNLRSSFERVSFGISTAKYLFKESWPLMLSGSIVLVQMNLDKLMLGYMSSAREVGLYSVGMLPISALYFLPIIFGASISPQLTTAYRKSQAAFLRQSRTAYLLLSMLMLVIALMLVVIAPALVRLVFGPDYQGAENVVLVGAGALLFVAQVSFRSRLLTIQGMQQHVLLLSVMAVGANAILNSFLIPRFGSLGAAVSTTGAWSLSALIFPVIFPRVRRYFIWNLLMERNKTQK